MFATCLQHVYVHTRLQDRNMSTEWYKHVQVPPMSSQTCFIMFLLDRMFAGLTWRPVQLLRNTTVHVTQFTKVGQVFVRMMRMQVYIYIYQV